MLNKIENYEKTTLNTKLICNLILFFDDRTFYSYSDIFTKTLVKKHLHWYKGKEISSFSTPLNLSRNWNNLKFIKNESEQSFGDGWWGV